jgi:hypothetical protein
MKKTKKTKSKDRGPNIDRVVFFLHNMNHYSLMESIWDHDIKIHDSHKCPVQTGIIRL